MKKVIENKLVGITRTQSGKGASRRLRNAGLSPAVVYSGGQKAISMAISPKDATKILLNGKRRNTVIELSIQDETGKSIAEKNVMVKDLQIHRVKRSLVHTDFVEIDLKKPVTVKVPLALVGKSQSLTAGGKMDQVRRDIKVECLPAIIPTDISIDITDLPFGTFYVSGVSLPEGLKLAEEDKNPVLTIKQPGSSDAEAEEETEEAKA